MKGVKKLAQETQHSDLYPYAKKSDTWVQKRSSKIAKTVFLLEKFNLELEKNLTHGYKTDHQK